MALTIPASRPLSSLLTPVRQPVVAVPELSVVIVNYRCWDDTARLLECLQDSPVFQRGLVEAVVVDNHSPPHPLASRLRRLRGVSLRRWGRNHGFARAANEGCRLSRGQWFLLLNPDVTLANDFLEEVVVYSGRLTADRPDVGIVGFGLRDSSGADQPSAGRFPTLLNTIARMILPRARRKYLLRSPRRGTEVPWVTGCCLLANRDCFRDLGGFDEDYFLYYEDVDLCRRAVEHGWTVYHEPALTVTHHNPLHRRAVPPHLRLYTRHALLTYAAKHWPAWQFRVLAGLVGAEAWLRADAARRKGEAHSAELFGELRDLVHEMATGRQHAARNRLSALIRRQEKTCAP